jgi:ribonuclease III
VNGTLEELQQRLGVVFADRDLLQRALTHPSWTGEHGDLSYQRLEFLGDSVLGFVVADLVHSRFPDRPEGDLTRMKLALVSGVTLAGVARDLRLSPAIRVGKGAEQAAERDSVLEACFEAIVGAVYLDRGLPEARTFVLRTLGERLEADTLLVAATRNPKGELQELAQARALGLPTYEVVSSEGPVHDVRFVVRVVLEGRELAVGSGSSKQAAEQEAAKAALVTLGKKRRTRR